MVRTWERKDGSGHVKQSSTGPKAGKVARVIRAVQIRREDDDTLHYGFSVPLENGREKLVLLSQGLKPSELAAGLRKFTSEIASTRDAGEKEIKAILDNVPETVLIGAVEPGWKEAHSKFGTFVTPAW